MAGRNPSEGKISLPEERTAPHSAFASSSFEVEQRTGVRVVYRARLESVCTLIGTEGSNPSLSATTQTTGLRYHRDPMKRLLAKKRPATTKDQWVLKGAWQDLLKSKLTSAATRWEHRTLKRNLQPVTMPKPAGGTRDPFAAGETSGGLKSSHQPQGVADGLDEVIKQPGVEHPGDEEHAEDDGKEQ